MSGRRMGRVEVGTTGFALMAVVGEWVAHTLEYMRLRGVGAAFGSAHRYMGPIGVILVVAAVAGVHSTARLVRSLDRRLHQLRCAKPRNIGYPRSGTSLSTARLLGVPSLLAVAWVAQCAVYVLQENLEATAVHRVAPGLAVLAGGHAWAPLVQLAVAGAVAVAWSATRRPVTRLAQAVRLAEARLRSVPGRGGEATKWPPVPTRAWTPIDRWGAQLWGRPPPAVGTG